MDDALDGMDRRRLEEIKAKIEKRLQSCTLCGNDGAIPVRARTSNPSIDFSLMICRPCIEKERLPEKRSEVQISEENGQIPAERVE